MAYSTTWEQIYEQEGGEVIDALAARALLTEPTLWPISGVDGDEWPNDAWFKLRPEQ